VVELLIKEGISVCVGPQVAENIPTDVNKIIYTIAVREDNEEFAEAKKRQKDGGVELLSYPQALGEMTKNKKTISICGTHGKTTTTALVYHALRNAGINISMIVGSLIDVDGKKTNYIGGDSDWIVIESCEYRRSFLNYNPEIILVFFGRFIFANSGNKRKLP
jgi:UDP-N-acetylmuramate--alanine ligase